MRLVYLLLILLTISSCTTQKNTCIDLRHLESKAEKYTHKRVRFSETETRYSFTEPARSDQSEFPISASLKDEPDLSAKNDIWNNEPAEEVMPALLSKKELKEQLKAWKTELSQKEQTLPASDTTRTVFDQQHQSAKTLAIVSLASSVGALLFSPLAVVGLITGIISLKKYKKSVNKQGRGMALAGTIIGAVFSFLLIVFIALIIILLASWGSSGF